MADSFVIIIAFADRLCWFFYMMFLNMVIFQTFKKEFDNVFGTEGQKLVTMTTKVSQWSLHQHCPLLLLDSWKTEQVGSVNFWNLLVSRWKTEQVGWNLSLLIAERQSR